MWAFCDKSAVKEHEFWAQMDLGLKAVYLCDFDKITESLNLNFL
jgi:hypothetical protein